MDWQLVASYFTVKSTDIFYSVENKWGTTNVAQSFPTYNPLHATKRYMKDAVKIVQFSVKDIGLAGKVVSDKILNSNTLVAITK